MPSTSLSYRAVVRAGIWLAPVAGVFRQRLRAGLLARQGAGARIAGVGSFRPRPGTPAGLVPRRLCRRRTPGRGRAGAISTDAAGLSTGLHSFQPIGGGAGGPTRSGCSGLPAVRPARAGGPVAGSPGAPPARLREAGCLGRALDPRCGCGRHRGDRSRNRKPRQWPTPVACPEPASTGLPGRGRSCRYLRRRCRPVSAFSEFRQLISACWEIPGSTAWLSGWPVWRSDDPLLLLGKGAPTIVAGSTWPADESILLSAFSRLHREHPSARLILVPHEPTEAHLAAVERTAARIGLPRPVRLSAGGQPATAASGGPDRRPGSALRCGHHGVRGRWIWNGWAALGTGARSLGDSSGDRTQWTNSREAGLLLAAGGAMQLPSGPGPAAEVLYRQWQSWLGDEPSRVRQGRAARAVVEGGLGAAQRSAEMLAELISSPPPRMSPHAERSGHRSAR